MGSQQWHWWLRINCLSKLRMRNEKTEGRKHSSQYIDSFAMLCCNYAHKWNHWNAQHFSVHSSSKKPLGFGLFLRFCRNSRKKRIRKLFHVYFVILKSSVRNCHTRTHFTCVKLMKEFKCADMPRVVQSKRSINAFDKLEEISCDSIWFSYSTHLHRSMFRCAFGHLLTHGDWWQRESCKFLCNSTGDSLFDSIDKIRCLGFH